MILVVEDSAVQAARLRAVLEGAGYEVRIAPDGERGIALCAEHRPEAVLTDVVMPGMDGLELTRRIKADPAHSSTRVIVLTGSSEPADVVRALEAGADNFLAKPYEDASLVDRVARTLAGSADPKRTTPAHRLLVSALEDAAAARKKADDANHAKDDFLAMLSHELRTPLNAITGWSSMLRSGTLGAAAATRAVEVIERNAWIQTRLIEDMLDVSRIATGELRLDAAPLRVGDVVEAAIDAVRPEATARTVTLGLAQVDEASVIGDAARLQQVVWNLLVNAVKFSEPGGRVEVSVRAEDGEVQIIVRDHGRGIPAEQLQFVFERFRQAHQRRRGESGLGLGLAIAKHIVERHGGRVEARSEGLGHGASFVVSLPQSDVASPARHDGLDSLDGLSILLVDDEADVRELVSLVLRGAGATVEAFADAREAVDRASGKDILVSDISMPVMDGYALMRSIRARPSSEGGKIRAIALTAVGGQPAKDRALAAGFDVFLTKPMAPRELVRVVSMVATPPPRART